MFCGSKTCGLEGEQHPAEQNPNPSRAGTTARRLGSSHRLGLGKGLGGKAFKLKLFTASRMMGSQQGSEMGQDAPQLRHPYSLIKVTIRLLKTGLLG